MLRRYRWFLKFKAKTFQVKQKMLPTVLIIALIISGYLYLAPNSDTDDIDTFIIARSEIHMIERHLTSHKKLIEVIFMMH